MRTHFRNEMNTLQASILRLGEQVCANIKGAVKALAAGDRALAAKVMRADYEIDKAEVRNEETCLKIIALHQPVADDLRYLIVMLKVNGELERISDLAVGIAEKVHLLVADVCAPWEEEITSLGREASRRLRRALDALVHRDADASKELWRADADVDIRTQDLQEKLKKAILSADGGHPSLFALLAASRHVERLADHIKNIAKNVIYLALGEIVRHRSQEILASAGAKIRVLFVCVHNSARSQMAEAWLNHLHGERFEAESAGIEPGTLHPLAVAAMRETGIDISRNPTRDVFDVVKSRKRFDYVITVCDEASAEKCPPARGSRAELHWSFRDPAAAEGTDDERMALIREIRDAIRRRVEAWAADIRDNAPPA